MRFSFTKIVFFFLFLLIAAGAFVAFFIKKNPENNNIISVAKSLLPSPTLTPIPTPPISFIIPGKLQVFQSFNNCGPASLSMMLSYFGINETQQVLGQKLRPYQNPDGDNDDKSVTLEEIANEAQNYGLVAYQRPNGDFSKLKQFVSNGIPVLVRTWLHPNEDIGHYRVIRGYDEQAKQIIQDDSFEGKDLRYDIDVFNSMWEPYNYEYVVLVPKEKIALAKNIIGEDVNYETAWKKAAENSEKRLSTDPNNIYARFNLSVALYNIGEYKKSTDEFEKVETQLPIRTLWYQIEPIEAYYKQQNYSRVFEISDRILNNQNRAFTELYIIRGNIYLAQAKKDLARQEFEAALLYNQNSKEAQEALSSL